MGKELGEELIEKLREELEKGLESMEGKREKRKRRWEEKCVWGKVRREVGGDIRENRDVRYIIVL